MARSSSTVFVIVEDDLKPPITATLRDANGVAVQRTAKTVHLRTWPVSGGAATVSAATWADDPTNTRPTLAWTSLNKRPVGVYYGRWVTDTAGDPWSFPTEDPFTLIVTAK